MRNDAAHRRETVIACKHGGLAHCNHLLCPYAPAPRCLRSMLDMQPHTQHTQDTVHVQADSMSHPQLVQTTLTGRAGRICSHRDIHYTMLIFALRGLGGPSKCRSKGPYSGQILTRAYIGDRKHD